MKIPVYDVQQPYQTAAARHVQLAQPLLQKEPFWSVLQAAGDAITGIGNVLKSSKEDEEKNKKSTPAAPQPLQPNPENPPAQPPKKNRFTDPERIQLYQFGREKVFDSAQDPHCALERLDQYAASHKVFSQAEEEDLWTQDYVVLRRETEQIQNQIRRSEQQAQWGQGEQHFIQTAALVRTPNALQHYIESNLKTADTEAFETGAETGWPERREGIYTQAVKHNVEAALASADAEQAQAVYSHFEKRFSEQQRQQLQHKINWGVVQSTSEKWLEPACAVCLDEAGTFDEEAFSRFMAQQTVPNEALSASIQADLRAQIGLRQRKIFANRARQYEQLAEAGEENTARNVLVLGIFSGPDEFKRAAQALRQMQKEGRTHTNPAGFNYLYENQAHTSLEEIASLFDQGHLSGKEYLTLYAGHLRLEAGQQEAETPLLTQALERLAEQEKWTEKEAENIKYGVYTSAADMPGRWRCARRMRKLLHMQEEQA